MKIKDLDKRFEVQKHGHVEIDPQDRCHYRGNCIRSSHFTILLHFPGLFVSLSAIALGVLIVAMHKGSFAAVGLKPRAIALAMTAAVIVFLVSGTILLFVDRP